MRDIKSAASDAELSASGTAAPSDMHFAFSLLRRFLLAVEESQSRA